MREYLNYSWSFKEGFSDSDVEKLDKAASIVDVPHCVKLLPHHYFDEEEYQGIYTYQKVFDADLSLPNAFLVFEGAMLQMDVYLNGEPLGHYISGYFPVRINVSGKLKAKNNLLTVKLDSREDSSIPPFGNVVDYLTFGGIYRNVYLDTRPSAYIEDLFIQADMDGNLTIEPTFVGEAKAQYELYDHDLLIASFDSNAIKVDHPTLWSIDNPHLYLLKTTYGEDVRVDKIGFRSLAWKEEGFFLNGKKTKLIGLNRHQTYPYFGPAAPESLQREDAYLLKKDLGVNVVRTSHYADDESFLSACDELGLLLLDEIPGWQYIGQDEAWRNNCLDFAKRLILKERNHPCLIAYGLRIDESGDDHDLYSKIREIHQTYDPSRASLGVRNFKDSECLEDIYAYNDFSCDRPSHGLDPIESWKGGKGKPKLVTENNGHMFSTKSFDPTPKRVEQALRHARVMNDAYAQENLCGELAWCAFDYATHKDFGSADHICYHGVMDIFRNKKYASYVYASQFKEDVLFVASTVRNSDFDECLLHDAVIFTDADYVDAYFGEEYIGSFYPDGKNFPHLPHPPIVFDDVIGARWHEPAIKEGDAKKIVKMMNLARSKGLNRLDFAEKLMAGSLLAKKEFTMERLMGLFDKYVIPCYYQKVPFTFVSFKNGEERRTVQKGTFGRTRLRTGVLTNTLVNGITYDCVSVHIEQIDPYGNVVPYGNRVLSLSTSGPIQILGPSLVSLEGGATTVYVRSLPTKKEEQAMLTVESEGEKQQILFLVK